MIVIMLGAPASGKGTQSVIVAQRLKVPHISTGDIFRWNIANNTAVGEEAKKYIDKGILVPDELTIRILKERIEKEDCERGFVLDGFPRTINQQQSLDRMLTECNKSINMAINLSVTDDEVIRRIFGRRMCKCGKAYHIVTYPPKTPLESVIYVTENCIPEKMIPLKWQTQDWRHINFKRNPYLRYTEKEELLWI